MTEVRRQLDARRRVERVVLREAKVAVDRTVIRAEPARASVGSAVARTNRMLAGLMSLWTTPCRCMKPRPSRSWRRYGFARDSPISIGMSRGWYCIITMASVDVSARSRVRWTHSEAT